MSPERFSAFRLQHVMDAVELAQDEPCRFALTIASGHWDEDRADGARLYFPKCSPSEAGILEVWSSAEAPEPLGVRFLGPVTALPALVASGNRVLAAIEAPVRLGAPMTSLEAWPGRGAMSVSAALLDPRRKIVEFSEGTFDVMAVLHEVNGLLALSVGRRDLVEANDLGQ
jgi:hypothetical protein